MSAAHTPWPAPPRARRWLLLVALALLVLLLAVAALCWRALYSEPGTRWLLRQVPGLVLLETRGTLLGGDLAARRAEWRGADGTRIEIEGFAWRGLRWRALPYEGAWLALQFDSLGAERVVVHRPPAQPGPPPQVPASLRVPLWLHVERLQIGSLRLGDANQPSIDGIEARLQIGSDNGAVHAVDRLRLTRRPLTLHDASLRIAGDSPFAADARADVAATADAPLAWRAQLALRGPLERLHASATLSARGMSADAKARLLPFAAWPLPALDATTRGLDVSALFDQAPQTALDARLHIELEGLEQPARIDAEIANAAPGRIDERRLPLRRIELKASAQPDRPQQIDASSVAIEFADASASAGRFDGRIALDGEHVQLDGRIAELQPQRLDSRAAPLQLGGPLAARIEQPGGANRFDVQAELAGTLPLGRARRAIALRLDAAGTPSDIELRRLHAHAGDTSAELSGRVQRPDAQTVLLSGRARLDRFDPLPFWPGRVAAPVRRGPHRLDADATFDLRIVPPQQQSFDAWLAALDGDAALTLRHSLIAGVPASGTASLRAGSARLQGKLALDAAGNTLRVEGAAGRVDQRWQLALDAPSLAALAPLVRLVRPDGAPLAGAIDAKATLAGRWPRIAGDGEATLRKLSFGDVAVERADARWRFAGTSFDAPLELRLEVANVRLGTDDASGRPQRVSSASLRIDGTLASHRVEAQANSPLRPPAWVEHVDTRTAAGAAGAGAAAGTAGAGATSAAARTAGASTAAGTADASALRLRAQGNANAEGWRGRIDELRIGAPSGASAPWLAARDIALALALDGTTKQPTALDVEPGRIDLLGARLAWQRIAWRAGSGAPQVEVAAQLEPLAIAPILARLQPDFGWRGDLKLGARIDIKSTPSFVADVVVQRSEGDLAIVDPVLAKAAPQRAEQRLGLSELRLALAARDGIWHFSQALAGTTVGVAAGAQSLRVAPNAVWPPADTPLEGVVEAQVADLGVWGTWLPPGWRIGGMLRTSAAIGGRFGAPEYTGRVSGRQLALRNVLEGVNMRDGEIDVVLQGPDARIEHFVVHGGDGTLGLSGGASFGEAPRARLKLQAERFQVLGRVDRRIVASGDATLELAKDALELDGRLKVDEGLIDVRQADAPSLGDDVDVIRAGERETAPQANAARPARDVQLDLRVDLGEQLRVRGRGIDARLAGELHLGSPRGRLAVNGTVRVVDGKYAAYGQKLDIERGVIAFNGPVENPRLDILAIRPKLDVKVGVSVVGSAQAPRVRLTSEPEMSDTAKLSWLILGREPDGLGRTDAALLQRAALGVLAGEDEGGGDRITRALGLDELSVSQTEGETRDTVVTLGKQLGERWYVGYERGLNATAGSWQLVYRIARRLTLRAQSGLDNSLDVIWTWRW